MPDRDCSAKRVISIEDLDDRKRQVAERLVRKFEENRKSAFFQEPEKTSMPSARMAVS